MPTEAKLCPKCQGKMAKGYLFESTVISWFEGEPEAALLGGAKPPLRDKGLPNVAYRCNGCGYVEFYATSRTPAH